ncbi:MAG: glycosyltransferase family 4 protein [Piscinibacter sp.]|uniref:glycosyltransferase family 4 protein n=1 Tax=Piscinibacter sp. TaxID=1903157 RepID=UPI001B4964AB|nr:glycosyltransferase family 4 protein [Piscinibacter sp.]MBP5988449.1 glycosyltransferase family 4 protein [Piscinibacter sp.]MBP6026063.1 glycosyltransferase family 4 protein [Piscinibacter sp.]
MNILYVNHYAGAPAYGMEYRPYYLAREWVRAGHKVRVLAGSYSHVRARQPTPPAGDAPAQWLERIDGIEYVWYRTRPYSGNGLGRVRNIAEFLGRIAWDARRTVRAFSPQVVIASSTYPMDIWVARCIARRADARLVFEVHDLWPASPIELSGMSSRHPFILICQKAENDAYRDADVVVSMLPMVAEHMAAHGLDLRKLHVVPNGISPEEWDGCPTPLAANLSAHIASERAAGRCVVVYAGSHGEPNALDVLLDAARLTDGAPISFVLVGDGHERQRLVRRVADEGLRNVAMFSPVPKAQIPSLLALADIAYIGWKRQPLYRFGIAPNKLMDYMMAGVPILHSVEAGNDPVAEAGCGLTVAPESPGAVAEGLRRLAAMAPAQRREMGARGRPYVLKYHAYPRLARRFLEASA